MDRELPASEYHPELLSRRGEMIAWGLALLVLVTWLVILRSGQHVLLVMPLLAAVLSLAAASISFGNWMDRRTLIRLGPEGVIYQNGLRHVNLSWDEIHQVQVFPSGWGKKVRVISQQAYFEFRTLGEVKLQGEVKGRMGFAAGDQILQQIIRAGHLKQVDRTDTGYYYACE